MSARSRAMKAHGRDCSTCRAIGSPRVNSKEWRMRRYGDIPRWMRFLNRRDFRASYFCFTPARVEAVEEVRP